jgi:hypothetical protein
MSHLELSPTVYGRTSWSTVQTARKYWIWCLGVPKWVVQSYNCKKYQGNTLVSKKFTRNIVLRLSARRSNSYDRGHCRRPASFQRIFLKPTRTWEDFRSSISTSNPSLRSWRRGLWLAGWPKQANANWWCRSLSIQFPDCHSSHTTNNSQYPLNIRVCVCF